MRKSNLFATALLTATIGTNFGVTAFAEDPMTPDHKEMVVKPGDIALPPGIVGKELNERDDVRSALAKYVNAVLTKDNKSDITDYYVDQDRNRLAEFDKMDEDKDYDGRIAQIAKDWKAKYNEDFKVTAEVLDNFVIIREGEIADAVAVRSGWPVAPVMMKPMTDEQKKENRVTSEKTEAEAKMNGAAREKNDTDGKMDNADANLGVGRNVAVLAIPGSHGLPTAYVSYVHELPDSWVIDLPNKIDSKGLRVALLTALTGLGEKSSEWPADKTEAYRAVTHAVILATLDVSPEQAKKMGDKMSMDK